MLGMSKGFVITLALAGIIGWGTHSFNNFLTVMAIYVIVRIIWNVLT